MKYLIPILILMIIPLQALATDNSEYNNNSAQGGDFHCMTSPTQTIPCEIENILKFFFPQIITADNAIVANMTKIISLQQKQIDLLTKQNELLQKLVDNTSPIKQITLPTPIPNIPQNEIKPDTSHCYMTNHGVAC